MADAIVSIVLDRLAKAIEDHLRQEFNFLRDVEDDVRYLSSEFNTIRNVLEDAERRRIKEKSVKEWLHKLESVSYELDDVLDEWNYDILKSEIEGSDENMSSSKVCCFGPTSCLWFKKLVVRRGIDKKMKQLKEKIKSIEQEKDQFMFIPGQRADPSFSRVRSTSFVDESEIYGRGSDRDVLVNKLVLSDGTSPRECGNTQVLCIVGAGGIGKTTLAQMIYNDARTKDYFDLRLWVCVSDVFDEVRIAKGILECATGKYHPYINELEELLKRVSNCVSGKRFLLVLDDVWNEDYRKWEPLRNSLRRGGLGSKILVTTRNERAGRIMGLTEIHRLCQLSDLDCCQLLRRIAFLGRDEEKDRELMQDICWKIAKKCKGLPLAAKAMGSLLRFKTNMEEWENVLQSETWELEEKTELFPHLLVSYNELPPAMRRCFSYCAIFHKGSKVNAAELVKHWMALGYLGSGESGVDLELRGQEYFENLAMRSFFQDFHRSEDDEGRIISCKIHDIVHDFARFLKKAGIDQSRDTNSKTWKKDKNCTADLQDVLSQAKEYRSLFYETQLPASMFKSLTCLKVLRLRHGGAVPREIEHLIRLRYLDLSYTLANPVMKSVCKLYNLQTLYLSRTGLVQVPDEIGKLVELRHLDLSWNPSITELPNSICNLHELKTLNVEDCESLTTVPEGMNQLRNLRHFCNKGTKIRYFPKEFWTLGTGLRTLNAVHIGKGCNGFGSLKNLNRLHGSLTLYVDLIKSDKRDDLIEARNADFAKKGNVRELSLMFEDRIEGDDDESTKMLDVMEALQTPPNLRTLHIYHYKGFKFPNWSTSSLKFLKELKAYNIAYCSSLPAFGKLPCLKSFSLSGINGLQVLGRDFLGLTSVGPESNLVVGFPKLEKLSFGTCRKWIEWEDITEEEEESDGVMVMPCLKHLEIRASGLTKLPHRLLRKASAIEGVWIWDSPKLEQFYQDKNGYSAWKSISHIPRLNF